MKTVYERPKIFTDAITTYCGGCGHGIVNRLIAELIDEMGLQRNGIIVWPIGCSCLADKFYEMDQIMALHGRAPATATGIKRAEPDKFVSGYPINMAETLATLQGVCYSERVTVTTPQNVMKAKKAIKKAFDLQMAGKGMTFVEVLSPCPTNWGMQPIKAMEWINEVMVEQYPLGVFKDEEDEAV